MLLPLPDKRRRVLARCALLCCSTAVLIPLSVQSSLSIRTDAIRDTTESPLAVQDDPLSDEHIAPIVIRRDPFVPDTTSGIAEMHAPMSISQTEPLPVVRAIVLGAHARALLATGGSVRVVGVGDSLAQTTIAAIDRLGLTLADGRRLALSEESP